MLQCGHEITDDETQRREGHGIGWCHWQWRLGYYSGVSTGKKRYRDYALGTSTRACYRDAAAAGEHTVSPGHTLPSYVICHFPGCRSCPGEGYAPTRNSIAAHA